MGVEHLPEIVEKLIEHGRSVDTPAALIREGTTQNQLVVTATLEQIVAKSREIHPPAVLIVGEVVRLHEQLEWFVPQAVSMHHFQTQFVFL
jgi:siroheme synthase